MKLYILTCLFRYEYLQKIRDSIPDQEDIVWIIAKSSQRESIAVYGNAKIVEVDCEDTAANAIHKMHALIANVQEGFFMILDDDTVFHPGMYQAFLAHQGDNMIIGKMLDKHGNLYLEPHLPECGRIDAGNALCRNTALQTVNFFNLSQYDCPDGMFWKRCAEYFNYQSISLVHDTIAIYNALR